MSTKTKNGQVVDVKEIDLEEALEKLTPEARDALLEKYAKDKADEKRKAFVAEYQELCDKYGLQLLPPQHLEVVEKQA